MSAADLASIRECNTLHGFQATADDTVVFAWVPSTLNTDALTRHLRAVASTVQFDDWIGHDYVKVASAERSRIPALLDAMLAAFEFGRVADAPAPADAETAPYQGTFVNVRNVVTTSSGGCPITVVDGRHVYERYFTPPSLTLVTRLEPNYVGGETFSIDTSEAKYIERLDTPPGIEFWHSMVKWFHVCERLWKTEAGRQHARDMVALNPAWATDEFVAKSNEWAPGGFADTLVAALGIEDPAIDFPVVEPRDPAIDCPVVEPRGPAREGREEANGSAAPSSPPESPAECYICMDAPAQTVVLPCGHFVVCNACSEKLKTTPDAHTCVRCRRPISMILTDAR
jgi:hypothetical protein